jgi:hypothetical protein
MPDPGGGASASLDEIVQMGRERPGLIGGGSRVAAQIDRDDMEAVRQALLGQTTEAPAESLHAVHADDRRGVRGTPLVNMKACQVALNVLAAPGPRDGLGGVVP